MTQDQGSGEQLHDVFRVVAPLRSCGVTRSPQLRTASSALDCLAPEVGIDANPGVDARYGKSLQRYCKHQRTFKRLLLERYPHCCAVCGFDKSGLLEGAQLDPDAEGGPSTVPKGD
jgi:hypothetical protein